MSTSRIMYRATYQTGSIDPVKVVQETATAYHYRSPSDDRMVRLPKGSDLSAIFTTHTGAKLWLQHRYEERLVQLQLAVTTTKAKLELIKSIEEPNQ